MDLQREDVAWHLWNSQRTQQQIKYLEDQHHRSIKFLANMGMTEKQLGEYGIELRGNESDTLREIRELRWLNAQPPLL